MGYKRVRRDFKRSSQQFRLFFVILLTNICLTNLWDLHRLTLHRTPDNLFQRFLALYLIIRNYYTGLKQNFSCCSLSLSSRVLSLLCCSFWPMQRFLSSPCFPFWTKQPSFFQSLLANQIWRTPTILILPPVFDSWHTSFWKENVKSQKLYYSWCLPILSWAKGLITSCLLSVLLPIYSCMLYVFFGGGGSVFFILSLSLLFLSWQHQDIVDLTCVQLLILYKPQISSWGNATHLAAAILYLCNWYSCLYAVSLLCFTCIITSFSNCTGSFSILTPLSAKLKVSHNFMLSPNVKSTFSIPPSKLIMKILNSTRHWRETQKSLHYTSHLLLMS